MAAALAALIATSGCGARPGQGAVPGLGLYAGVTDAAVRGFFGAEARAAGVRRIRAMTAAERAAPRPDGASGCALAWPDAGEIAVDVARPECLHLHHLSHEIAHVAAARAGCRGHGDRFYAIDAGIAARFEAAFPGARWGDRRPTDLVRERALTYRAGEALCPSAPLVAGSSGA